jgi:invasion protein IalB
MNIAESIIAKFGGEDALAVLVGKKTTVLYWKQLGTIPAKWQTNLLKIAQEQGIPLAPSDFLAPSASPPMPLAYAAPASTPVLTLPSRLRWLSAIPATWLFVGGGIIAGALLCLLIVAGIRYAVAPPPPPTMTNPVFATAPAANGPPSTTSAMAGEASQWFVAAAYGNWKIKCRNGATPANLKALCSGTLEIDDAKLRQPVFLWEVGRDKNGILVTNLYIPTGVLIDPGVGLQFDKGEARRLNYVNCGQRICVAVLVMDDAFLRAASSASAANVTISPFGRTPVTLHIPVRGFAQMLDYLR